MYTATDVEYHTTSFHNGLVRYGLIKTAGAAEGFKVLKVLKVKIAYYAVLNVVSVFNDGTERIPDYPCEVACGSRLAVYGRKDVQTGQQICVFWTKGVVPSNQNDTVSATLTIKGGAFSDPVWVDTMTGGIYEIPKEKVSAEGDTVIFQDVPAYDAPAFITDKKVLSVTPWMAR